MDALWKTHVAVNKGVKAFGDWLLTLRGGLRHELADLPVEEGAGDKKRKRKPTEDEVRQRRVLLALSWLSVEAPVSAVPKYLQVATGKDSDAVRSRNLLAALHAILEKRRLAKADIASWEADCRDSLSAAIRPDAVWVNRSEAFDRAAQRVGRSLSRDEVWDMLSGFFNDPISYLTGEKSAEDEDEATPAETEKAKDLGQKAGQWLSSRFGTGKGADFSELARVYRAIADSVGELRAGRSGKVTIAALCDALSRFKPETRDLVGVLGLCSAPGHKSATTNLLKRISEMPSVTREDLDRLGEVAADDSTECNSKTGSKGHRPYADTILADAERASGLTYLLADGPARHWETAVILDHAARRMSVAHSWIKLAEASRRQFDKDAQRIKEVPDSARLWLDRSYEERSGISGGQVQIRPRAVDGWEEVVKAWSVADVRTREDRINEVHRLQDELEKFGDVTLFERLADEDAKTVWLVSGKPDPELLRNYVKARDAEAKRRRFKVPAYRHPDPLLHPVFCDFGKSRWAVEFAVHEAALNLGKTLADVKSKQQDFKSAAGEDKIKAQVRLRKAEKAAEGAGTGFQAARSDHRLTMKVWDGRVLSALAFSWQSKRFRSDMALDDDATGGAGVSRADRAGRAAANVPADAAVTILNVFEEDDWNGRLQVPRAQLEHVAARVEQHGWDSVAENMRRKLQWSLTFSARLALQDKGPWPSYVENLALRQQADAFKRKSTKGIYITSLGAPHLLANQARAGHARLDLCRLPGLRVLSVDLGHRYAAACAVWETMTSAQVVNACKEAGAEPPGADALCLHVERDGKKTIYRRIGADKLDGRNHPAPWARLDRQFLIKLQGEEKPARKAGPEEVAAVEKQEEALGRTPSEERSLQVDELMFEAVRTARLALRRHGDRARIAFNLLTDKKLLPGSRDEPLTPDGRKELLADTLVLWCSLDGSRWTDSRAKALWKEHLAPWPTGLNEDLPPRERKAKAKTLKENLMPLADRLAGNPQLCKKLSVLWGARWHEDNEEWRKRLRWLRDWILPRGADAETNPAIRNVGGLSLTRLATIRGLRQVMTAYRTRPEPENPRKNVPAKDDDSLESYGQRILDTLEHMRENRVKQLASRIVEAALGIGSEKPEHWHGGERPQERVHPACHAVVVENLEHYRPEQTRTRRENRQLMNWSAAKVLKYLREACDLSGLHLRQVMPNYTSRQDSRTGAPGIRCSDMSAFDFVQRFAPLLEKLEAKGDAESQHLLGLLKRWKDQTETKQRAGRVRIPQTGGELFVSAHGPSPAAKGLQADLNAAANIGLRALLDPDWPGKWWWVPCEGKTAKPNKDKVKGCACIDASKPLIPDHKAKSQEVVNLWRDVSAEPVGSSDWKDYKEYWNGVRARVIGILREQNGLLDT
jgi:IS605 OrfB family transposase